MSDSDKMLRDLLERMQELERTSVHYRQGTVTATSPLSVALGGSSISYTDVSTMVQGLAINDVVGALVFGNGMFIVGRIGGIAPYVPPAPTYVDFGPYQTSMQNNVGGVTDSSTTVTHNLGLTSTQRSNVVVFGHSVDGGFAALMGTPRIESQSSNSITFKLGNPSSTTISMAYKFWIRTTP